MKKRVWIPIYILALIIIVLITYRLFFHPTRDGNNTLVLYGNVDIRQVDLGFRVEGRIDQMFVDEGDPLVAGQLIATLDTQPYQDEAKRAEANLATVQINLENATKLYQRRLDLYEAGAVSREDLEDSETVYKSLIAQELQAKAALGVALTRLHDTKVYAPVDGWVLTRVREPGAVVKVSDPVFTESVKTPVWIRAYVNEVNLGHIYPNMRARIYTDSHKNKVYNGHIGFISPVAEFTPKTVETTDLRTDLVYRLRVIVDAPDLALRQGMPVTVELLFDDKAR